MAWNIPNVPSFGEALNQGVNTGSSMFARIMQPILERERLAQQMKIHKDALALQQAAAGRAAALAPLQLKLEQLKLSKAERELDPAKQTAYIQQLIQGIRAGHEGQNQGMPNQETMQPFTGMGMPNLKEMEHPTVKAPTPEQLQQGGFNFTPEEQMALGMAGFKFPKSSELKEPPGIKRAAELKDKLAVAKYNHELKLEEKRTQNELKNEATRSKVINDAKNDLPHLNETLRGLKIMEKIADDPRNDDMFGHWFLGAEKATPRITNPNAGDWQVHGLGPIVEAEMKMSARGNQLALKSALANKPNFAEPRPVAARKIKATIGQIERRIQDTKKIAGMQTESNEAIVIDPNGQRFSTTAENAKHLPSGWRHG